MYGVFLPARIPNSLLEDKSGAVFVTNHNTKKMVDALRKKTKNKIFDTGWG
jgi:hypothetical protein